MRIEKISNHQAEEFLKQNFSSPTHWPDWNVLVAKYYHTKFYYWGYFENITLVGVYPVHELKYKKVLKQTYSGQFHMIPNGGWIFSKKTSLNMGIFPAKWNNLQEVFTLPILPEFNLQTGEAGKFKKTLVVDLDDTIDDIWMNSIHSKRRNMIRKAQKAGVTIERVTNESDLEDFYCLYTEASARFTGNPMTLEFFKELFFTSINIKLDIYMAKLDGRQIANVGVISDKNYSLYWLGNNVGDVPNIGQGELLQWHTIQQMKEKGCKYYDLCYIEPEKLPHIYKFKKGFSKTEVSICCFSKKSLFFKIINKSIS